MFYGALELDEIVPAMGEPAGVAINIVDADGAMLFPPVVGIAADEAAQTWKDTDRAVDNTFGPSPEERAAQPRQQPPGDG